MVQVESKTTIKNTDLFRGIDRQPKQKKCIGFLMVLQLAYGNTHDRWWDRACKDWRFCGSTKTKQGDQFIRRLCDKIGS